MLNKNKYEVRQIVSLIIQSPYSIFGFIYLIFFCNIIKNDQFDNIFWSINLKVVILFTILILIFRNNIKKFFNFKTKGELFAFYVVEVIIIFFGNIGIIPYINTFGEQKEIIIETVIIKKGGGYKHNKAYIKLMIDREPQKINVRHHNLKVGDIYKMKIYQGWLGIKYYKPNDGWGFHKSPYKVKKRKLDLKTLKYIPEKEKD